MNITLLGGGITGCITAFTLAQAGHTVTLYEKETLGSGASGQALGGLFPYTDNIRTKLAFAQRQSIADWPALAQHIATTANVPLESFFKDHGTAKQINIDTIFPTLRTALHNSGVDVRENTTITNLTELPPSDHLLLAAGWGNKPWAGIDLHVQHGQALRVKWESPVTAPIYGEELYILPTWQPGEVLIGSSKRRMAGPDEASAAPDAAITQNLLERANKLIPGIAQAPVLSVWTGFRPSERPVLPFLRPVTTPSSAAHVHRVAGLGGMGYCLAPAVAQAALALS